MFDKTKPVRMRVQYLRRRDGRLVFTLSMDCDTRGEAAERAADAAREIVQRYAFDAKNDGQPLVIEIDVTD